MKHIEIIKAWLDGKQVQFKLPAGNDWFNLKHPDKFSHFIGFYDYYEYRIAPEKKKLRVWESVYGTTHTVNSEEHSLRVSEEHSLRVSGDNFFKRWITDWIEYEAL